MSFLGPLFPDPLWVMSQEVPSGSGTVPVLIQIWDSDDNPLDDDDDQGDINPIIRQFHVSARREFDDWEMEWGCELATKLCGGE